MQSSKAQPVKAQAITPNIASIPSPSNEAPYQSTTTDTSLPSSQYPDVSQFTFLPDLYLIISRLAPLRHPALSDPSQSNGANGGSTTTTSQQQHQQTSDGLSQTISRESQTSSASLRQVSSSSSSAEASIEIKDLPAHVYAVKQGIARAKEQVLTLPDIERSVDAQEAEISALKGRIAGLKGRLGELGQLARSSGHG